MRVDPERAGTAYETTLQQATYRDHLRPAPRAWNQRYVAAVIFAVFGGGAALLVRLWKG